VNHSDRRDIPKRKSKILPLDGKFIPHPTVVDGIYKWQGISVRDAPGKVGIGVFNDGSYSILPQGMLRFKSNHIPNAHKFSSGLLLPFGGGKILEEDRKKLQHHQGRLQYAAENTYDTHGKVTSWVDANPNG